MTRLLLLGAIVHFFVDAVYECIHDSWQGSHVDRLQTCNLAWIYCHGLEHGPGQLRTSEHQCNWLSWMSGSCFHCYWQPLNQRCSNYEIMSMTMCLHTVFISFTLFRLTIIMLTTLDYSTEMTRSYDLSRMTHVTVKFSDFNVFILTWKRLMTLFDLWLRWL